MIHPLYEKYAHLLVAYCCDIQPGETVAIHVDTPAEVLARAVYREVLKADALPILRLRYPEVLEDLLELASDSYYQRTPNFELSEAEQIQNSIHISSTTNSRSLQNSDKDKLSALAKRNQPVQELRLRNTKWVVTRFPTHAAAQDAGMSLSEYERFVYDAMFLFDDDPLAKWLDMHDFQARLITRLEKANEIRIIGPDTDLRLNVKGREWINSDGRRNMPSGEVFTGPHEASATGSIRFGVPASVSGIDISDIRLRFEGGKVVESSAAKGQDFLLSQLDTDAGARFLGELGIGTNYRIKTPTRSTLYDEKIGGTIHLALGRSYPETGGKNDSAIHWDMICDLRSGGAIYLDGELFQENGLFVE
ncbi:MAG: aminopeptidase [Trueperaceae bacterium]|nr:MAG: aminopeptidase [Trueperaceae bacterium]